MNNIDKWFGPMASVIVVAANATLTFYMWQQVEKGLVPWWPYPAFAVLVITIFTTYGFLTRGVIYNAAPIPVRLCDLEPVSA